MRLMSFPSFPLTTQPILSALIGLIFLAGSGTLGRTAELVVGVRVDAPPFAFHAKILEASDAVASWPTEKSSGSLVDNGFSGYVVTICSNALRALAEDGVQIATRPVNAKNRFELLESGDIHVLCDPATVTRDRAKIAVPSAPIYLSAITYARKEPIPNLDTCKVRVGFVGETTAPHGLRQIIETNTEPRYWEDVGTALQALENEESSPMVQRSDGNVCEGSPIVKRYDDHQQLATDFCAGRTLFYIGDVEIVRSMLALQNCIDNSVIAPAIYSNERYAIFFAKPSDTTPNKEILQFQMKFYSRFSPSSERTAKSTPEQRSILFEAFQGTRELTSPSKALRTFFWAVTGDYPN